MRPGVGVVHVDWHLHVGFLSADRREASCLHHQGRSGVSTLSQHTFPVEMAGLILASLVGAAMCALASD